MKKLSVFLLLLLASCPFISAHEDDDNESSEAHDGDYNMAPYSCDLQTANGYYSAEDLYKSQGNAYSGKDSNGNTVYFNLCGDLSSLDAATLGCDPTSAVCIQTAYNSFVSAGKPYASWEEADDQASDVSQAIEIVYTGGDSCYTNDGNYADYQTTIILNCSSSNDFDIVSVTVENCQVTIQALSMDGCPQPTNTHVFMFGPIIAFTLTCLACCGLTFCCCACIRRRRDLRRQSQNVEMKYQPVAQRASQPVTPQPVVPMHLAMPPHMQMPAQPHLPMPMPMPMHMQPYMMPTPMHFQPTPQYFQPQPYFQPQAAHLAPAPLVALEDVNTRDNQVTDDEKLARELQAKFDNE